MKVFASTIQRALHEAIKTAAYYDPKIESPCSQSKPVIKMRLKSNVSVGRALIRLIPLVRSDYKNK